MSEICISRGAQRAMLLGTVGAMGLAVAAMYPEIQRYLKIRSM
jgi:hypothetical protein